MSNPYLAASRSYAPNDPYAALDPQTRMMLAQMQGFGAPGLGFGASVAPLGAAALQQGGPNPMVQPTAAPAGPLGAPAGPQSMRPLTPLARQPQPGEGFAPSDPSARPPGDPSLAPVGQIDLFRRNAPGVSAPGQIPTGMDMPNTADLDLRVAPLPETKKIGPQGVLARLGAVGDAFAMPGEKSGLSPLDLIAAGGRMYEASQPSWDLSSNRPTAGSIFADTMNQGRERVRQTKADAMAEEQQGWAREAAGFANEERTQQRTLWKDEAERKKVIATAILDPALPIELRKALPTLSPDQQAEALAKYLFIGPEGVQNVQDGRYVRTDWRGNQVEGDLTPGGRQAQENFNRELGVRAAAARGAGRPEGVSPGYVKLSSRDQMDAQRYATEAENGQEALITLKRIQGTIQQLGQDEFGQPIPAAGRNRIRQIAGSSARARGLHQQLNADTWNIVLENLKGLAPVSEAEIRLAMERTVSGEWTQEQALRYVDNLINKTQRMVDRGYAAVDWANSNGSYASGRDAQGRSWADISRERYKELGTSDNPGGSSERPPPRRPGDQIEDGNGNRLISRDGKTWESLDAPLRPNGGNQGRPGGDQGAQTLQGSTRTDRFGRTWVFERGAWRLAK